MKNSLNYLLLVSFIITNLVPITGIPIHKMASVLFLLFCIIHTIVYRKQLNGKRWLMVGMIGVAFSSGLFGMIFDETPLILAIHKVISIGCVFVLAIHIFIFNKRLNIKTRRKNG